MNETQLSTSVKELNQNHLTNFTNTCRLPHNNVQQIDRFGGTFQQLQYKDYVTFTHFVTEKSHNIDSEVQNTVNFLHTQQQLIVTPQQQLLTMQMRIADFAPGHTVIRESNNSNSTGYHSPQSLHSERAYHCCPLTNDIKL